MIRYMYPYRRAHLHHCGKLPYDEMAMGPKTSLRARRQNDTFRTLYDPFVLRLMRKVILAVQCLLRQLAIAMKVN